MIYDLRNWYWTADDGRVFSSKSQTIIDQDDDEFLAWLEAGGVPTKWPVDDAGEQTDAALQWVFDHAGAPVFVDLLAYAADRRWRIETGGIAFQGVPVATDDRSKLMLSGARIAAAADPGYETTWYGADGEGVTLDAAAIIALSDAVLAHVEATFAAFGLVKAGIAAGTITTVEAVDAAFDAA